MSVLSTDFCFCTLAFGEDYQVMAKQLGEDLVKYSPGVILVVGTDQPNYFSSAENIWAYKQEQLGILHCYNDKRFVYKKAFSHFKTAIFIDADTRILNPLENSLFFVAGLDGCVENLLEHMEKYRPKDLPIIRRIATKLNLPINESLWVGESLLIITVDEGKEEKFLEIWGEIAVYAELYGMHSGEGNLIGLAAQKAGVSIQCSYNWQKIDQSRQHLDASVERRKKTAWQKLQRRLQYHYRLNKTRLLALRDFDFYYK